METIAYGILWYIVFLLSLTLHEASHAFVAMKLGDPTACHQGQVSLNPFPHIRREPFGAIVIPWLSFFIFGWMLGWASAPYDPVWANRYPKRSALMSLAGPAANFLMILIAALLIRIGMLLGWFYSPESVNYDHVTAATSQGFLHGLAVMLSILFTLNLVLFVFNLLPLPPLDGSGALPLILNDDMNRQYRQFLSYPIVSIIGLLLAWHLFGYICNPFFLLAVNLLYPGANYY